MVKFDWLFFKMDRCMDKWMFFFKLRATPRSGSQSAKAKSSKHRVDASGDKQGWLDFSKTFKKGSFSLEDFEENPSDEEEDEEEEETLPKDLMTTLKMKTGKDKDKDKDGEGTESQQVGGRHQTFKMLSWTSFFLV